MFRFKKILSEPYLLYLVAFDLLATSELDETALDAYAIIARRPPRVLSSPALW